MRQVLLALALALAIGPGLAFGAVVTMRASEAEPWVDQFRADAARLGVDPMPDVFYSADMPDAPPDAAAVEELVTIGRQTFDGDPADGGLLYWPLLVVAIAVLSAWAIVGSLMVYFASRGWLRVAAATTLAATIAVLLVPPVYFDDTIDVVSHYVD